MSNLFENFDSMQKCRDLFNMSYLISKISHCSKMSNFSKDKFFLRKPVEYFKYFQRCHICLKCQISLKVSDLFEYVKYGGKPQNFL